MADMKFIGRYGSGTAELLLLNLGVLSIAGCILSYSRFAAGRDDIVFSLSVCLLLHMISRIGGHVNRILCCTLFAAAAFYFVYGHRGELYPSLLYTANGFIDVLKQPYHLNILPFKLAPEAAAVNQQPAVLLMIFLTAALLQLFMKTARGCAAVLALTVPVCLSGLYFNVLPDYRTLTGAAAFWLALLVRAGGQMQKKTVSKAVLAAMAVFICGGLVQAMVPKSDYVHPQFMQHIPQSIRDFLDSYLSPGGRATSIDDIRHGINGQGRLGDMDTLTQTGRRIMQVQTSLRSGDRLYLRNYSGAIYRDNSWNDLPENVYKEYDRLFEAYSPGAWYDQSVVIFESLKGDGRGQRQLMEYLRSDRAYDDLFAVHQFRIEKMFAEENQYFIPYNMDISSPAFKYDKIAQEAGIKVYRAAAYEMPPRYDTVSSFIANYSADNKYILYYAYAEKAYRDFAYKYYRQVPAGVLDEFLQKFPVKQVQTEEEREQLIAGLQKYFQANYKYTISPGRVPAGKDFVSYFLNESHEGYCTYFASAATLILRQAGIPARYVVGYAVPDQTVAAGQPAGADDSGRPIYDFTVSDKQAHAWVEIYEDGWGWRPIDFTPGFDAAGSTQNTAPPDSSARNENKTAGQNKEDAAPPKPPDKPENKALSAQQGNPVNGRVHIPAAIILLAAAAAAAALWRKYCRGLLVRRFSGDADAAGRKRAIGLYAYMEALAQFVKLKRPAHMDYLYYAEYLRHREERWADIPIEEFVGTVLEMRFGTKPRLEKEELERALAIIKKMRHNIYSKLNFGQKIIFAYFYRL